MPTIEIHEPEVKTPKVSGAAGAAVLPGKDLVPAYAGRTMFSDSLLEFGAQSRRKAAATTLSFILNCVAILVVLAIPLIFTDQLPKAQLLTMLVAPPPPPPPPPLPDMRPTSPINLPSTLLRGMSGMHTAAEFPISFEPITMGRDPRQSQIVFPDDTVVSKRHCTVRLDGQGSGLIVEDCGSTNGTFLDSGERLRSGEPRRVPPGACFYLGDRSHLFQVE